MKNYLAFAAILFSVGLTSDLLGQINPAPVLNTCTSTRPIHPWRGTGPFSSNHLNKPSISLCSGYGNVGIGTSNPSATLDILGDFKAQTNGTFGKHLAVGTSISSNTILAVQTSSLLSSARLFSIANRVVHPSGTSQLYQWNWVIDDAGTLSVEASNNNAIHLIAPKGKVGIASDCVPNDAKLAVGGKIICEEVEVKLKGSNCWADYVFEDDYQLKPLSEIEQYIKQHKHLPGIPSAQELSEDGVDVKEMLKLQMEKIEELTLHIIEQEKKIKALEAQK